MLETGDRSYYFIKREAVCMGGQLLYYTGVMKRLGRRGVMKWTTDPVTQVLAKLRDSAALQGVDFCRAYPDQMKPSRLLRPVVAVCLAEMDGTQRRSG